MVDIVEYRCRIGSFRGKSSEIDQTTLHVIGVVGFIGLLLFMAGVELNPGPGSIQVRIQCTTFKYSSIVKKKIKIDILSRYASWIEKIQGSQ